MLTRKKYVLLLAVVVVVSALVLNRFREEEAVTLRIATATRGGTYYPLGTQLGRNLEDSDLPIASVVPLITAGSRENIGYLLDPLEEEVRAAEPGQEEVETSLLNRRAQLAFVPRTTLSRVLEENPAAADQLRLLADLYEDDLQIVVRRDSGIGSLADLSGKAVYLGKDLSGTLSIAEEILLYVGISDAEQDEMRRGVSDDYTLAAEKLYSEELRAERLDAAFFLAGTPVAAVTAAMESGCCFLLDLRGEGLEGMEGFGARYSLATIPAGQYLNQEEEFTTLATTAHLIGHEGLKQDLVAGILDTFYDNIYSLLQAHTRAENIEFRRPQNPLVPVHPGVDRFWDDQPDVLKIATGAIEGRYHRQAITIQEFLEEYDIRSRPVHSDGSVDNLTLLGEENTLAFMQLDVAVAANMGGTGHQVYGLESHEMDELGIEIPTTKGLRQIASFGDEVAHVISRGACEAPSDPPDPRANTIYVLEGLVVGVGPDGSGSRIWAEVLLFHHGVDVMPRELSVEQLEAQLNAGQIQAAFFTSAIPNLALGGILDDPNMCLLSIDPQKMGKLSTDALFVSKIPEGIYGSQGNRPVQTIETQTVLVTTEDQGDLYEISAAIFENYGHFRIDREEIEQEELVARSLGILIHPDVDKYLKDIGLLPSPPVRLLGMPVDAVYSWLQLYWQAILIVVVFAGGGPTLLKRRRNNTFNEIGREIFSVSVEATETKSVAKLIDIRRDIRGRVRRRWWMSGEIDKERWRKLEDLVNLGIREAKEHLEQSLIKEIRALSKESIRDQMKIGALERRLWAHLENGELDAEQHSRILEVLSRSI